MSLVLPDVAITALNAALKTHVDSKRLSVAVLAWVVYDLVLTMGDSISLFWIQDHWSISKVLFFLNQIAVLITTITINILNFASFYSIHDYWVATWIQFTGTSIVMSIASFPVAFAIRVDALWKGSNIVLTIYSLSMATNIIGYPTMYGWPLYKGNPFVQHLPFTDCFVIPGYDISGPIFACSLIFEGLSIGLIFFKAWPIARQRGITTPSMTLLLEDGLAYFLACITSSILVICAIYIPTTLSSVILPSFASVLISALAIIIRLRRIVNLIPAATECSGAGLPTSSRYGANGSHGTNEVTTIVVTHPTRQGHPHHHHHHHYPHDELLSYGDIELYPPEPYMAYTRHGSPQTSTAEDTIKIDSEPRHVV